MTRIPWIINVDDLTNHIGLFGSICSDDLTNHIGLIGTICSDDLTNHIGLLISIG